MERRYKNSLTFRQSIGNFIFSYGGISRILHYLWDEVQKTSLIMIVSLTPHLSGRMLMEAMYTLKPII